MENKQDLLAAKSITHHRKWIAPLQGFSGNNKLTFVGNKSIQGVEENFTYNKEVTILAVDDSIFVKKALESLPVAYERKFEFAKDGVEALKKYQESMSQGTLYHLILMDLEMPIMDGFEAIRNIRAEEAEKGYPRAYICAMSVFEDPETIDKAKREGMDNFCQKPVRLEMLNELIKVRLEDIAAETQAQ